MTSIDAPSPLALGSYDTVIFDLGGVILPLDYSATTSELSALLERDVRPLYTQAKQSELFDRFERGEITAASFREQVHASLMSSPQSMREAPPPDRFDPAWNAMLGRVPEENVAFLLALREKKRTFLLSNTNEIHLAHFLSNFVDDYPGSPDFGQLFEAAYYSHEMGLRKPEAAIFRTLIQNHSLEPRRTLFIDDNPSNLQGAREIGLVTAYHPTNFPLTQHLILDSCCSH